MGQLSKVKKRPKTDKVSSRIRLEAYKINLTPTSGQSPAHKTSSNHHHTEESNTEAENTADENTADENTADEQEKSNEQEKDNSTFNFLKSYFCSFFIMIKLTRELFSFHPKINCFFIVKAHPKCNFLFVT